MKSKTNRSFKFAASIPLAITFVCGGLAKADNTWDGGGSSPFNWSDATNWGLNTDPGYGTLTFAGTLGTTNTVDANYSMNQLLWTGSSAWTLNSSGGAVISLFDNSGVQAKIENQSITGLVTINAPINFAATTGAAWGEINAVNGDITFGSSGTISVIGSALTELRFFGSGRTVTIDSVITAGARKLVIGPDTSDNNTVSLNGNNSYSGNTEVNVGTVQVGHNSGLGTSTAYLGNGGSTFANLSSSLLLNASGLAVTNAITTNKADTGAGLGTGTRTIGGNFTSGTSTISGGIALNGGAVLTAGSGGTVNFTGVIQNGSDTGNVSRALTINAAGGTVGLSNASNNYTGGSNLTAGTLSFSSGALGTTGAITMNGGTLQWATGNTQDISSRFTLLNAKTATFDTNGNNVTLATAIGGSTSASLVKTGAGILTLTGQSTYTGGTTVDGGKVVLGFGGSNGTVRGTLSVNAGATVEYSVDNTFGYNSGVNVNVLNINGGTVGNSSGTAYGNHFYQNFQLNMTGGTLYLGSATNEFQNATVTVNNSATTAQILAYGTTKLNLRDGTSGTFNVADGSQATDLLITAPITYGSGTSGITKAGAGTMNLTGSNTYNGTTLITGGTLVLSGASGALTISSATISGGATLKLDNTGAANNASRLGDAASLTLNNGTLQFANDAALATNFSETTGTLNVLGGLNTITSSQAASGQTSILTFGGLNLAGGLLNFTGTGLGMDDRNKIVFTSGVTNGGMISGATINGSGLVLYSATNGVTEATYTDVPFAGTIINGPTTNIRLTGGTSGDVLLGSATTTVNTILQNQTSATTIDNALQILRLGAAGGVLLPATYGSLTIGTATGSGTLTAGGAADTAGTLNLTNNDGTSLLTINSVIANNGTGGVGVVTGGTGKVVLAGINTYTGTTVLGAATTEISGGTQTLSGIISGTGILLKTNAASTLTLSGPNTYTGATNLNAGTLKLGNNAGLGASSLTTVASGATLDVAGFSASGRAITIAGVGVGGLGALYNSSTTDTDGSGLGALTLSASATMGGASNTSAHAVSPSGLDLAGNTLTLASGRMVWGNINVTTGNIDVNNGVVMYWVTGGSQTGGTGTITLATGATLDVRDYSNTGWTNRHGITLDGGTISNGGASAPTPGNGGGAQSTIANNITVGAGGGTLNGNNGDHGLLINMNGSLLGNGALAINGSQGIRFQGDTSGYTGTATVASGTTLAFNGAAAQTFNGNLAGAGAFRKEGSNTVTLTGANSGTGTTTVLGGTLKLDYGTTNNRKINSGALTLSGGTIELAGGTFADSVATTTLTASSSNTITQSSGAATLNLGAITRNTASFLNFGLGGIARTSTANNATGILGSWATIGGSQFARNDGSGLIVAAATTDLTRLSSGSKVIADGAAGNIRFIEGTGTAGNFTLGAAATTINTLTQSSVGGTTAATVDMAGQTLALNTVMVGTGAGALAIGTATNNGTLKAAGTALEFRDLAAAGITVNSVIADGTGATSLTKTDAGTLTFSGTNTYTGGTTVNAGTLTAALGTTAGARTTFGTGAITAASGTTLRFFAGGTGNAMSHANAINLNAATLTSEDANQIFSGNFALTGANTVNVTYDDKSATFSGVVSGAGSLTKAAGGVLTLSGNNSHSGGTTLSAGTLILSGNNTTTGGTTVSAGTLKAASAGALGASGQAVTLNGGTLQLASNTALTSKNLTLGGNSTITLDRASIGAGLATSFGNLTFGNNFTLTVNKGANVISGISTLNFTGFPALGAASTTTGFAIGADVEVNLSGNLNGTQAFARVTKSGAGTLILSGNNDWWDPSSTGLITVSGGTLDLRSQNAMGDGNTGVNSIALSMAASTTLRLGTNTSLGNYADLTLTGSGVTIVSDRATAGAGIANQFDVLSIGAHSLNVTGGSNVTSGITQVNFNSATLTGNATFNVVNPALGATNLLISGDVGGAFSVTKSGSGTLTLQGANTYSGATAISGGTLNLSGANGAIASSTGITLGTGGILTLANTSTANNGNRIAGTMAMNGGTLNFTNNQGAVNYAETTGALSIGGGTNTIATSQAAASQTSILTFASLTRTAGTLNFSGTGLGTTVDTKNEIRFTTNPTLVSGIIGPWATVNGTDFATTTGANNSVVAYSSYTDVTRLESGTKAIANMAADNVRIIEGTGVSPANITLGAATTTINTLNQSASGGTNSAIIDPDAVNNTLAVNSILVSSGAGGLTIGTVAGDGTLKSAGTSLQVIENSSGGSRINSTIVNGTGLSTFTKSGTGTLTLTGTNTYTGATIIEGGILAVSVMANGGSNSGIGAAALDAANLVLSNGTLRYTGNTVSSTRGFTIAAGTAGTVDVSTSGQTLTISGGIANTTGNFVKSGAGNLTLSGASSHTGTTSVTGGTLRLAGNIGSNASWYVGSGARMELAATNLIVGGHGTSVADSKLFTVDGGTLALDSGVEARLGNVTLSNGATLTSNRSLGSWDWLLANVSSGNAATITVANTGGSTAASSMTSGSAGNGIHLQGVQNFNVADVTGTSVADLTVSMVLGDGGTAGGTGGINKTGAGTMLLSGANSFTGNVNVLAGVAQMGNVLAFGVANTAATKVNVGSGATVDFNGQIDATYGYTITGTGLGGNGALVNNGATIGTGTKQASNITLAADASIGGTGNWALLATGYAATNLNLAGFTLTKSGANTVTLVNTAISAGNIVVAGGTLATFNSASTGTSTALSLNNTTDVSLNLAANLTVGSLAGGGATGGSLSLGGSTLTVGALNTSTTYSGAITSAAGGNIVKNGTGTFTLSNANAVTINALGGITVNAGSLVMNGSSEFPTYSGGAITLNNGTSLLISGARFDFSAANYNFGVAGGSTITANSGTNWVGQGGTATFTTNGGLKNTVGGTGSMNPNGVNMTFTVARGSDATSDLDFNIPMGNAGFTESVTKAGNGILTFNAANIYKGGTSVNAGTLQVGNTAATNGKVTLNGGNLLITSGVTYNIDGGLTFASNTAATVAAASGTATLKGFDVNSADIIVNTGITGSIASTVNVTTTGTYGFHVDTAGTGALTIAGVIGGSGGVGSNIVDNGTLIGTDITALYKRGTGDLTLTGQSTFTAGANVAATSLQSGRIFLSSGNHRLPATSAMYLGASTNTSGKLVLDGINQTVTGLATIGTGTGNAVVGGNATASTLTVNNTNNYSFSGKLGGTGTNENNLALTKSAAGTLTLTGANTYTGATIISAGTLALGTGGSIANSATIVVGDTGSSGTVLNATALTGLTIGSGQTLKGIGTVDVGAGKTLTIEGTHAPGNSVGSQSVTGNLSYNSGSIFEWDINANKDGDGVGIDDGTAGTDFDRVATTGTTAASGSIFRVVFGTGAVLTDPFWSTPSTTQTWDMSTIFGSGFSGSFAGAVESTADPVTQGSFTITGSSLIWSAVPEPTSALVGLLIGAGLLRRRRSASSSYRRQP